MARQRPEQVTPFALFTSHCPRLEHGRAAIDRLVASLDGKDRKTGLELMRAWSDWINAVFHLEYERITPRITLTAEAWASLSANDCGELEGHLAKVLARADQVPGRTTFLRALSPLGRDEA